MNRFYSIEGKLIGTSFLLLFVTILALVLTANAQTTVYYDNFIRDLEALGVETTTICRRFLSSLHNSLWALGALFLALAGIVNYFLGKSIARPALLLAAAARKIGTGDFSARVTVRSKDELGIAADAFNKMSERLENAERNRREFFAGVVHELRTPLAVLRGNLENMTSGVTEPTPEALYAMQDEVMRLARLVTDLRDFSLSEVHELTLHKEQTNLSTLTRDLVALMQPLFDEKEQKVTLEMGDVPHLLIDPDRIRQTVGNILANANRYAPKGGKVTVRLQKVTGYVILSVADNGAGVPETELAHLFDQFYRASDESPESSGIGLALARSFAESHGGFCTAKNRPEGGLLVELHLPL